MNVYEVSVGNVKHKALLIPDAEKRTGLTRQHLNNLHNDRLIRKIKQRLPELGNSLRTFYFLEDLDKLKQGSLVTPKCQDEAAA